jgi:hypothetical protein
MVQMFGTCFLIHVLHRKILQTRPKSCNPCTVHEEYVVIKGTTNVQRSETPESYQVFWWLQRERWQGNFESIRVSGKRSCIGESMARNNIFLTFTSLMQNYNMAVPEGHPRPCTDPDGGLVLCAKPFSVRMTPRSL